MADLKATQTHAVLGELAYDDKGRVIGIVGDDERLILFGMPSVTVPDEPYYIHYKKPAKQALLNRLWARFAKFLGAV